MSQSGRMESTPTPPGQKPAVRIGGACVVCRTKKRKCSGENGLPKHHIRKLESRLRRTETLLRSLLDFVSDDQLESSLRGAAPSATVASPQDKGNADPDVWQAYPLTTLEDVRAWQSCTLVPEPCGPPPARGPDGDAPVEDDCLPPSQHGSMPERDDESPCPIPAVVASPDMRTRTFQIDDYPASAHPAPAAAVRGDGHGPRDSRGTYMPRTDEPSPLASTFLPADFQKDFLW